MNDSLVIAAAVLAGIGFAILVGRLVRHGRRTAPAKVDGERAGGLRQAVARARDNIRQVVGRYAVVIEVISIGAIDLDPANLAIWTFVATDAERDRLSADPNIKDQLRKVVENAGYPATAISRVAFAFESATYVQERFGGDYWKAMR